MTKPRLLYGTNNIKENGITFSPQHLTPPLIKDRLGDEVYEKYFKFCFVRNPWDRIGSLYEYLKREDETFENFVFNSEDSIFLYLG